MGGEAHQLTKEACTVCCHWEVGSRPRKRSKTRSRGRPVNVNVHTNLVSVGVVCPRLLDASELCGSAEQFVCERDTGAEVTANPPREEIL